MKRVFCVVEYSSDGLAGVERNLLAGVSTGLMEAGSFSWRKSECDRKDSLRSSRHDSRGSSSEHS